MIKAFLFDLDGTIWDSKGTIIKSLSDTLSEAKGLKLEKSELLRKLKNYQSPRKILTTYDIESDYLYWKNYRKNYRSIFLFFNDTYEVLSELQKLKKLIGFITSLKKQFSLSLLKKFDLYKYGNILITPSECRTTKPSPTPINIALEKLSVSSSEALYIGDQNLDMIAAKRAGCKCGLASWGVIGSISETPDYVFHNLKDVLSLVRE